MTNPRSKLLRMGLKDMKLQQEGTFKHYSYPEEKLHSN